jgi:hypothetical protein
MDGLTISFEPAGPDDLSLVTYQEGHDDQH